MSDALLFDLDETLMVDESAAVAAFEATARLATSCDELNAMSWAPERLRAVAVDLRHYLAARDAAV